MRTCAILIVAVAFSLSASGVLAATDEPAPAGLVLHWRATTEGRADIGLQLIGRDSRQQLLATAMLADGGERDWTRRVAYEVSPAGVVQVSESGMVTPAGNGAAMITARSRTGLTASIPVSVEHFDQSAAVNFPNQIVPIFTKTGCNGGGCHGKSSGQNGFRLSLLGFEPMEDYEYLVKEARGRRIFPAAPDRSLLLLKGTATLPHGGGKRMEVDSDDYRLLVRWIRQGMPYGNPDAPSVDYITVFPGQRTMPMGGEQQLVVTAHYSDGSTEDVTRSALYEPNDKNLAQTDPDGFVRLFEQPGDVAVMIRYQAKVAVFRATIPLGAPVARLPEPANFIDEIVFAKLKLVGMPASETCDDPTFVRRITLDIAGRLPTPGEIDAFLAIQDPDRRSQWIDRLIESADYADFFANKWAALLRNKRSAPTHTRGTYAFHAWIRDSLAVNKPYDQLVQEILAASGDIADNPPVAWYRQVKEPTAQLEDTAQLFLGMRLQCAQCHHHPYEKWSQQDYYRFSAFFSRVGRKPGSQPGEEIVFHRRGLAEATNKKTNRPEKPAGLGAAVLELPPDDDPREALGEWLTDRNNPYFAKSLVNRYWKHFFSRGLVEPEDDMRETNPATNPELLEALARHFVDSGYDLKQLVRTITRSRSYQLSAMPNEYNAVDKQYFSRYYPRRLTAEVLYDAVNHVTLAESRFEGLPPGTRAVQLPDNSFNASSYFLTVFGRPESSSACECERSQDASLAQSLHLINSKDIQKKLTNDKSRAALLAKDDGMSDDSKIRDLYRLVYARDPSHDEMNAARAYVGRKSEEDKANGRRLAYEDMIWALLNTKEFLFNH